MPDFGTPVAQNINPTQGLTTLSDMMGLQQKQQAIQSGALAIQQQQQNLQRGASETQMQQQTAQQRQGIANIDWSKYDDGTGVISTDKMLGDPDLRKSSGDQFLNVLQQGAQARLVQLQNKQALTNLNGSLRDQFGSMVGALRTDPDVIADNPTGRQKVTQAMDNFAQSGGPDAARIAQIYAPVVQHAPQGGLVRGISAIQLQAMDASHQAGAQGPNYADTGARLQNVNPQAAGGNLNANPNLGKSIPPGMSTFADQAGNTWAFNPQNPGHAIQVGQGGGIGGGGGGAAPAGGAPAPGGAPQAQAAAPQPQGARPPSLQVGEPGQIKANTDQVNQNRQAAQNAQTEHDILQRIQGLAAKPDLYLGKGSADVASLANLVAQVPGFEKAAEYANNYNELTKFMAQNAARQGQALGLSGSDSRLEMATHAQPNADPMDKRTVQSVSQYMGGIVRMGLAKADAMDRWMAQPGNSIQNEHQFEQLWRDNADPRLFQLSEMKDQGEAANYAKLHIRPNEQAKLKKQHDVLQSLGVQL